MKTYKATWRYYFFLILFTATSLVGARAEYMLWTGQVSFGDDLTAGENKFLFRIFGSHDFIPAVRTKLCHSIHLTNSILVLSILTTL